MSSITLLSPAKVNLVLAITGVRNDGFHELVSLVAPVTFGDEITVALTHESGDTLECDFPGVPTDSTNLAMRAVEAFRQRFPFHKGVRIDLDKRIPAGAGLGGGSSNASTVLSALNQLWDKPLSDAELKSMSAKLGSDCPLFLAGEPIVMRGRGERLSGIPTESRAALKGQRLLLFKPSFAIDTAWAYKRMKEHGGWYCPPVEAEELIRSWTAGPGEMKVELYNNMEQPAFEKYLALPTVLGMIREQHGARCLMSGSGSACLVWLDDGLDVASIKSTIRECLGEDCFCVETAIA